MSDVTSNGTDGASFPSKESSRYNDLVHTWDESAKSSSSAVRRAIEIADAAVNDNLLREGVEWYVRALVMGGEVGDTATAAVAVERLGDLYTTLGDYPAALDYQLQSLSMHEEVIDLEGIGRALHSIGVIYGLSGDYGAAHEYLSRSIEAFREAGVPMLEVAAVRNLGEIHFTRGDLDRALDCILRAQAVYEALGDHASMAATLLTLAGIYGRQGRNDAAFSCALNAQRELQSSGGDDVLELAVLLKLGRLYHHTGANDDARFVLEQGVVIAGELGDRRTLHQLHADLASVLEAQGNHREALDSFRRSVAVREEFTSQEKQKSLVDLQLRYDLERGLKDEEIRQRNNVVQAIIETQEAERGRIAGELHDGIGQLLAAVRINLIRVQEEVEYLSPERRHAFETSMRVLDTACRDLRTIAHTLSSSTLRELGIAAALQEMIGTTESGGGIAFSFDVHGIGEHLPEETELALYRIAQEILANALKHAAATRVHIQLVGYEATVVLMVEDNGLGFNPAAARGGGMGMRNMEARVKTLNGRVTVDSAPGHGTTVTVELPNPQSVVNDIV